MRVAVIVAFVVLSVACGGSSSSPVAPTPTPVAVVQQPAPTPPPPQFPTMTGGWSGTFVINSITVATGARSTNTCNDSWTIDAQTGGQFSGSFQNSGGTTVPCGNFGRLTGNVSTSGAVSDLRFESSTPTPPNAATQCTRISGNDVFAGSVNTGALSAQNRDRIRCTTTLLGSSLTNEFDRTRNASMNKR